MDGQLFGANGDFRGVSTDSRTLQSGELFFALKGENFDGHDMCEQAGAAGATASVVSQRTTANHPHILVDDTRAALGRLASAWRDKHQLKVVGVTGSNGKTTVKGMVAAILRVCKRTNPPL